MVKKLFKFFLYALFFIAMLIFFIPKISLYYFAEKQFMKPYSLIVSSEKLQDNGFSLTIKDAKITLKSIPSAEVKTIDIKVLALYNTISIKDIKLASMASSFVPLNIYNIDIKYTILNPLNITIKSSGDFGDVDGRVDIVKREIYITLKASQIMRSKFKTTLKVLKRDKNGEYIYEKNI